MDITNNLWDFEVADLFHGDEDDTLGAGGTNLDDGEAFLADAGNNNTVEAALSCQGSLARLTGDLILVPCPIALPCQMRWQLTRKTTFSTK